MPLTAKQQRAASLYAQGLTAAQVGTRMKSSKQNILKMLTRAGVLRRQGGPPVPRVVREGKGVARRYAAGGSSVELAREFGSSPKTVLAQVRKHGGTVRSVGGQNTNKSRHAAYVYSLRGKEIVDRYLKGEHTRRLAAEFRISTSTILSWVRGSGNAIRGSQFTPTRKTSTLG